MKLKNILLVLAICTGSVYADEESLVPTNPRKEMLENYGSVLDNFSPKSKDKSKSDRNSITWFKSSRQEEDIQTQNNTSAKTYLWQASLDAISFMPIAVSDSYGGVISTDWYEDANNPSEKFKVNILIKSSTLKAQSLEVKVFKKVLHDKNWHDVPPNDKTSLNLASSIKDKILIKAKGLSSAKQS